MAEKTRVCDIPKGVNFTISGVDSKDVIPGYPELVTVGFEVRFLWDNSIMKFIKDSIVKLFRRR